MNPEECVYRSDILLSVDPDGLFLACTGFQWDDGNVDKDWVLHRVEFWEAEEIFFNQPLILRQDPEHSLSEPRYFALGRTDAGRHLFVSFTIRLTLIRVISARDMTRRELQAYGKAKA